MLGIELHVCVRCVYLHHVDKVGDSIIMEFRGGGVQSPRRARLFVTPWTALNTAFSVLLFAHLF